jgi:DNA polymerase/3'-5' exonuclease PolX
MNLMSCLCEEMGDHTRAEAFLEESKMIVNHAEQFSISVEAAEDVDKFKGLEGVDSTTLELFKEFVTTGEMKLLKDLKGED